MLSRAYNNYIWRAGQFAPVKCQVRQSTEAPSLQTIVQVVKGRGLRYLFVGLLKSLRCSAAPGGQRRCRGSQRPDATDR